LIKQQGTTNIFTAKNTPQSVEKLPRGVPINTACAPREARTKIFNFFYRYPVLNDSVEITLGALCTLSPVTRDARRERESELLLQVERQ